MRKPTEIKPRDVSKGLFMDLAFLLIAALVLLVNEPVEKSKFQSAFIETRRTPVSKIEESDLPGESLFLEAKPDGSILEILHDDSRKAISINELPSRVEKMAEDGQRVIVWFVDPHTPYEKVNAAFDKVTKLQQDKKISRVYEIVRSNAGE